MKHPRFLLLTALPVALISNSCGASGQKEDPFKGSVSVTPGRYEAKAAGETFEVTVKADMNWEATPSEDWVTASPSSGNASDTGQTVQVTVGTNVGCAREAQLTFGLKKFPSSDVLTISQEAADGIRSLSISEFLKLPDSDTRWYRLTAAILSFSKPKTGVMYVTDGTGQLLVYRMAPSKDGSYNDFPKLGLAPGDIVTFVAHRASYSSSGNVIIEAKDSYCESHRDGRPAGAISLSASQRWLELPATGDGTDGTFFITHPNADGSRNYSVYYDTENRLARWACYPYVKGEGGTGRNGDPYSFDPLLDSGSQPDLEKSFRNRKFGDEEYVRGHLVPSNDRSGRANYEVFFSTVIMPQSTKLNSGVWSRLETKAHDVWSVKCDTLYIVTGTYAGDSDRFVSDNSGEDRKCLVPQGIYKAFLARLSDGSYHALGAYFENKANAAKNFTRDLSMSIDELEKKVKADLFANLPDDVEAKVEAEDPSKVDWWWN